ncbi:hypothetical protein O1509_02740 [Bacteroides ovatus]|uniref:LamG-like jellyroll fold domain-containing protein n=1 Tax=Bacteroides ovatus TaxID=28116 RepID=UPI0022A9FBE2|nr:LamG-like jellyroll fold domain-containing protein [Bacteroides ovatus]MCZ2711782.1 hypothetical protein [Bacteroides ovatus]
MKRKLSFLFLSALTIPFFMVSCSDDKEEQEVKPATDLVVDNNSVTLLQGDEITVSITSGNGDYYVKPFDENVATATINGNKVTIKATENSQLEENNRTETTILIVDGRKKVARVLVRVAKLWDLTVDAPEEGFDLFIGEKRLVKILTGNGDYQISIPEGADKFLEVGELSGQVIPLTAKFETGADPVNITITDKKGKTITIPVVVNIVDLTLKSNEATFAEPDAESQYISIENGKSDPRFRSQQTIYCDDSEGGRKTPGKWYHIAIVYDGTKSSTKEAYKMYINGVRETLTPADNSYEDCAPNSSLNLTDVGGNDKALLIGRSGDSYRVGYCKVYQARMWKRALDESEIKANMCKILNAEEHSDLMGYWVFSKGVGGTTVFENWGNGGSGLDAQVCLQNISENKPAWGAELPATYNGDKSRFEPIECPHSY